MELEFSVEASRNLSQKEVQSLKLGMIQQMAANSMKRGLCGSARQADGTPLPRALYDSSAHYIAGRDLDQHSTSTQPHYFIVRQGWPV